MNSLQAAPIVLFVYNRLDHTKKTVDALLKNSLSQESELFIFSDGPKRQEDETKVAAVRSYIRSISGFKQVHLIEAPKNQGLANSVIQGVTQVVNQYGRVIVMEDDLITSPDFLLFMNQSLEKYKDAEAVMQISGYMYPTEMELAEEAGFMPFVESWGWATWKRAWKHFDAKAAGWQELYTNEELRFRFDLDGCYSYSALLQRQMEGKIDSWAVRWYWSVFRKNGLVLYPKKTLVENIGFDNSGTHCSAADAENYAQAIASWLSNTSDSIVHFPEKIVPTINMYNAVVKFLGVTRIKEMYHFLSRQQRTIIELQQQGEQLKKAALVGERTVVSVTENKKNHFCTLFDSNYLDKGLALYESLVAHDPSFNLYVVCFDEECYRFLKGLNKENLIPISLAEFESPELLRVKPTRSKGEYCWTCTPFTIDYCLNRYNLEEVTYIDADMYFFASPNILLDEFHQSNASILLSPHNYDSYCVHQAQTSGIFCVQFLTFKNDAKGKKALLWWAERCLEWCYARFENGLFGDQKYLDHWPKQFEGVHVLQHIGGGVAPWNAAAFPVTAGPYVNQQPVVFYHYHGFQVMTDLAVNLCTSRYYLPKTVVEYLYKPYVQSIMRQRRLIQSVQKG